MGYWNHQILLNSKIIQGIKKKAPHLNPELAQLYERLKLLSLKTPQDPDKFYPKFGLLEHDLTHKPVTKLAFYQSKLWQWAFKVRYRLAVKSQKIGISTSALMEDGQFAFLPPTNLFSTMGYDTLVIGQDASKGKEHIGDLTTMIKASREYHDFLIEKPEPFLKRTQVTNSNMIFLRNPWNPLRPSRIIGRGSNPGGIWSYKRVKKIHMSDVAATSKKDDKELFDASFSRLAITRGTMLIESPPRGARGQLYEIYKASKLETDIEDPDHDAKEEAKFKVFEFPYDYAIQAGVMTEEFFIGERERLGPRFGQYYECEFLNPFNTYYDESLIDTTGGFDLEA